MINSILKSRVAVIIGFAIIMFSQTGCTKDDDNEIPVTYPIQGLWEGTYTVGSGNPVPAGTSFYFSFSIYPGGKVSYKSKGYYMGSSEYITFADGTWTLTGTEYNFTVTTINIAGGGTQQTQIGKATYNSSNGTLSNGTFTNSNSVWTMNKVK